MIRSHPFTLRHHFFLKILITCWGVTGLFVIAPTPVTGEQSSTSSPKVAPTATSSPTNTINGELDRNSQKAKNNTYFNVHKFSGQAGKNIVIDLSSSDFDSYLILFDPRNNKIIENNDSGQGRNARIVVNLPTSGTYTILAVNPKPGELGKYQLNWRAALPKDIELAEAQKLNRQVIELVKAGKYLQAIPLAQGALALRQKYLKGDHPDVATSLNNLAFLHESQGRYNQAKSLYQQALDIRKRLFKADHPDVATSLNNLAGLYSSQGKYGAAQPLFQQALDIRKRLFKTDHPSVAQSLNNLAFLHMRQGRYDQAKSLYQQALDIRKRLFKADHYSVATSLNNLAALYESQKRYSAAQPLFQQALDIRKRLFKGDHPDVADSLNNLASLYESQGRYGEAQPLFQQALDMTKRLFKGDHPDVADSLNNLAFLYEKQERYDQAQPLYQQVLDMRKRLFKGDHPDVAQSLNNLAALYESQGKIDLAVEYLTQGVKIEERYLGYNLASGFEREKRQYLDKFKGSRDWTISIHLNSAPNSSQAAALALSTILQRKGRILDFLTDSQSILRKRLNDPESRKLLDKLSQTHTQLSNLVFKQPEELSIEEYRNRVKELETEAKSLQVQLSDRSEEFRTFSQPVTVKSIQKLIPGDTVLVEIMRYRPFNPKAKPQERWGKARYAAYILSARGEPQGIDLGEVEKIEGVLDKFRFALEDSGTSIPQVKKHGRQLDKILMEPVRKRLGSTRKILISPDSNLNLIPFEALVDQNQQYLVENYAFTYLTSGRDLIRLQNQSPTPSQQPPLVIADPNFNRPGEVISATQPKPDNNSSSHNKPHNQRSIDLFSKGFQPLPETEAEAKAIAPLLQVEPLLGKAATEATVKQVRSPKVLHIATHGFFETNSQTTLDQSTLDDNPLLLSGLVLAGFKSGQSGGEDGILSALETSTLNLLGTKLVVFSACETSLGKVTSGEGIYSLRRALVIAGSESQIMSLWKVEDGGTKDLMKNYYKRLLDPKVKIGRSEALRQTQLEMLHGVEYQHPYYWAAFIPSGNWKPIQQ